MKQKSIIILVISVSAIPIWDLLFQLGVLDKVALRILWFISICCFVYSFMSQLVDITFESAYFKIVFCVYLFYQFLIIVHGLTVSTIDFKTILREAPIFWPFIIPLAVFFEKSYTNISTLMKAIYGLGVLFLVLSVCFPSLLSVRLTAQYLIPTLATTCGFLLLNAKYLSDRKVAVAFLAVLLSSVSYMYLARRSGTFTFVSFIVFSYALNLFNRSEKVIFKILPALFIVATIVFLSSPEFFSKLTGKFRERMYFDTRTELFDVFFMEMKGNMLFGKGMNGTYYYPMEESIQDDGIVTGEEIYRNNIENGYLQLLLTGGVVNIILFVMVLLPAAINGIFKSNNQFTQACGIMIFLWLLDMFIYGLPTLSLHYILIWFCVGVCYCNSIRNKDDEEILEKFRKHKLT